ncbi:MAG: polyprenol phosphomannose-dependent alpha 1,6 mannosyltransferase MptB, partial [Pseudonocardiaceae bacterium]
MLLLDRVLPGRLLSGTVLLGLAGSALLAIMAVGAGGILTTDPLITGGPLSWIRYGHGRDLATMALYLGVGMIVWAWVRLGRDVLAGTATVQHVQVAGAVWIAPMVLSPPLFTRDVYSYLAQGALALRGLDPYQVGPSELPPGPIADNVHYAWQTTPAPYGPLFILIAKIMNWLTDEDAIAGVIGMRLVLLAGLGILLGALPRLADQLGGNRTVTLWLVVANPMTVVHLVGGPHNDLLMVGLLAGGTLLVLQRRHVAGITVVTVAMAVKASAGIALPFLVWIWAARLPGSQRAALLRAGAGALA